DLVADDSDGCLEKLFRIGDRKLVVTQAADEAVVNGLNYVHRIQVRPQCRSQADARRQPQLRLVLPDQFGQCRLIALPRPRQQVRKIIVWFRHGSPREPDLASLLSRDQCNTVRLGTQGASYGECGFHAGTWSLVTRYSRTVTRGPSCRSSGI